MAASDADEHLQNVGCRTLSLSAHVGFDSLPDQLIRKSIKHGFCFNILCIGETGIGKSALVSSLFNTDFEDSPSTHFLSSVRLRAQTFELLESNVLLKLTVVKTVGFGDQMNKADSYQPIVDYVDAQFEAYLEEELKVIRSLFSYHDTRIHVCLYFISPTGRSLKTIDLLTMRSLDSKVNIIPVIGKADSISKNELQEYKKKIMSELVSNGIRIYQFPTDDETVSEINTITNGYLPFAVVGSMEKVKIGNKMVRARQYPWGIVKVENESHCDTIKLRRMLCTNMEDLKEKTRAYYESYRRCRLEKLGCRDIGPENKSVSLQEVIEAKRLEFCLEVERKEEEIKQRFVQRVKEKATMLEEAEQQVLTKFEHLTLMHQEEELKLGEKKKLLEDDKAHFVEKKAVPKSIQSQVSSVSSPDSLKTQGLRKFQLYVVLMTEDTILVISREEAVIHGVLLKKDKTHMQKFLGPALCSLGGCRCIVVKAKLTECSQNKLSWKGPIRIIESSSRPCTGHPKSHALCSARGAITIIWSNNPHLSHSQELQVVSHVIQAFGKSPAVFSNSDEQNLE